MSRFANVTYERSLDFVHVQCFAVTLETWTDVTAFAEELTTELTKLERVTDVIVDLGELVVRPSVLPEFDDERLRVLASRSRRSYHYRGSSLMRTRVLTSATLRGVPANLFSTFAQAREALAHDRQHE